MPTSTFIVGSAVGLHARLASIIAEAVGNLDAHATLALPGGEPVGATSSLMIMTLGDGKGAAVKVASESAEAHDAIAALGAQDLDA